MLFFVLLALCINFVLGVPPGDTDVPSLGGSNDCEENCKPGPKGEPGIQGPDGMPGRPGAMGSPGLKGDPGFSGEQGLRGEPGQQGIDGPPGPQGERGFPGATGLEGQQGPQGPPGIPGYEGEKGNSGLPGTAGSDGTNGAKGEPGLPGIDGAHGRDGVSGYQGKPGVLGPAGPPGPKGDQGTPCKTTPDRQAGHILVKHSQSRTEPACGDESTTLWNGFSLVGMVVSGVTHTYDLGHGSSCAKRVNILPIVECNDGEVCQFGDHNDRVIWLMDDVPHNNLVSRSKCVVCDVPGRILTVHSHSSSIPECPKGWSGLWTGYSFLMHEGGGQSLFSSGSCLEKFRDSRLMVRANANYEYFKNEKSYGRWMITVETAVEFRQSKQQIQKGDDVKSRISRCQVCMKNK